MGGVVKNSMVQNIENSIFTIRGVQVMIDKDLAELYGVETKRLSEQVKRNIERFPQEFRFQLTEEEIIILRSQIATSRYEELFEFGKHGGRRYLPYVFTEQGVSMLSAVLRSDTAVQTSINIMSSFVNMRKYILQNASLFQRIEKLELDQKQTNQKLDLVFNALENKNQVPTQGIFYDGQIYDAYAFINNLLKNAKSEVVLIDNYIDDTIFTLFSKYPNLNINIYTHTISKQLELDFAKYKSQYDNIKLQEFKKAHDRFLIIDEKEIYHIGASLKDLGKKWFAFSKFEIESFDILEKLK